jgi:hypothetical protein
MRTFGFFDGILNEAKDKATYQYNAPMFKVSGVLLSF